MKANAPLAKLDIASVYGTEGQRFESPTARHVATRRVLQIRQRKLSYLLLCLCFPFPKKFFNTF